MKVDVSSEPGIPVTVCHVTSPLQLYPMSDLRFMLDTGHIVTLSERLFSIVLYIHTNNS